MKYKEKVGYEFRGYKLGYTITVDGIETTIIGMTPDAECGVLLAVDPVRLKNKGDWIEELVDAHISTSLRSPVYYLDVEYDGFIWVMSNDSKVSKGRRNTIDHVIELSDIIKDVRVRISNIEKDIKSLAEVKIDKLQDRECNIKVNCPIKLNSKYSILALLEMAHKQLRVEKEVLDEHENELKAMLKEE